MSAAADTCQIRKVGWEAAYSTEVSVELTLSASAKYLAPSASMKFWETLQTERVQKCQRLLTLCQIRKARAAAYLMHVSVLLTLSVSARLCTPAMSWPKFVR